MEQHSMRTQCFSSFLPYIGRKAETNREVVEVTKGEVLWEDRVRKAVLRTEAKPEARDLSSHLVFV